MTEDLEIDLPVDTHRPRIARRPLPPDPYENGGDDVTSAVERISAFRAQFPDGSIITQIESETHGDVIVFTASAAVWKHAEGSRPNANAHATRSTADPSEIARERPQETAETVAISRALRNLGILTGATPPPAPEPAPVLAPIGRANRSRLNHPVAAARFALGVSQKRLAELMTADGITWSQSIVSKTESGHRELTIDEARALDTILDTRLADSLTVIGS